MVQIIQINLALKNNNHRYFWYAIVQIIQINLALKNREPKRYLRQKVQIIQINLALKNSMESIVLIRNRSNNTNKLSPQERILAT